MTEVPRRGRSQGSESPVLAAPDFRMEGKLAASALRVSHKERFSFTMKSSSHGTGYPLTGATGTRREFTPPFLICGFTRKKATRRRLKLVLPATTHLVEGISAQRLSVLVGSIQ